MVTGLRHFPKENRQVTNKHMIKCLIPFDIREMQIKTTMKYYHIPRRTGRNFKIPYIDKDVENSHILLVGVKCDKFDIMY